MSNESLANESSSNSNSTFSSCEVKMYRASLYIIPVILVIGFIGNALSLRILSARALKCHSARVYLKTLAIVDSCVLLSHFFDWISNFGSCIFEDTRIKDAIYGKVTPCLAIRYFDKVIRLMNSCIIVIYSIERAALVLCPLNRVETYKKPYVITGIMLVLTLLSQMWIFPMIKLDGDPSQDYPTPCTGDDDFMFWWNMVSSISYLVCVFIIILSNIIIVVTMQRGIQARAEDLISSSERSLMSKANKRVTITLLCVSFCFVIATLPENFFQEYLRRQQANGKYKEHGHLYKTISSVLYMLLTLNYGTNYFIYTCRLGQLRGTRLRGFVNSVVQNFNTTFTQSRSKSRSTNDDNRGMAMDANSVGAGDIEA